MDVIARILEIIEQPVSAMGYTLVQVKMADAARRKTLSIMAERKDGKMMSFDDCTEITNIISALLDVNDPISGAYNLEVCSPGIDRPLTKHEDYKRFAGSEIKAETIMPVSGRKRFRGILKGIDGDKVTISVDGAEMELPFSHIRTAKLVMTDELVAGFLKKQN